jgi:hypothetical protein
MLIITLRLYLNSPNTNDPLLTRKSPSKHSPTLRPITKATNKLSSMVTHQNNFVRRTSVETTTR